MWRFGFFPIWYFHNVCWPRKNCWWEIRENFKKNDLKPVKKFSIRCRYYSSSLDDLEKREEMKKKGLSAILFLITFIATYLLICFGIPGMRIKLEAEPMELFIKSIKHMMLFKTLISILVASVFGAVPFLLWKKK